MSWLLNRFYSKLYISRTLLQRLLSQMVDCLLCLSEYLFLLNFMNRCQEKVIVNCYFYLLINKHNLNTIAAKKRGDFFVYFRAKRQIFKFA